MGDIESMSTVEQLSDVELLEAYDETEWRDAQPSSMVGKLRAEILRRMAAHMMDQAPAPEGLDAMGAGFKAQPVTPAEQAPAPRPVDWKRITEESEPYEQNEIPEVTPTEQARRAAEWTEQNAENFGHFEMTPEIATKGKLEPQGREEVPHTETRRPTTTSGNLIGASSVASGARLASGSPRCPKCGSKHVTLKYRRFETGINGQGECESCGQRAWISQFFPPQEAPAPAISGERFLAIRGFADSRNYSATQLGPLLEEYARAVPSSPEQPIGATSQPPEEK